MSRHPSGRFFGSICLLLVSAASCALSAADLGNVEPGALLGEPVSLTLQPAPIRLTGPRAMQQVVVTGRYVDGAVRDLTPFCTFSADTAGVAIVAPGGFVQPQKNGEGVLVVRAGPVSANVPVVVEGMDQPRAVSFRHEFIA